MRKIEADEWLWGGFFAALIALLAVGSWVT